MADCLPLALDAVRHAHFVGIGGSGMSGLARLFRERGQGVSGCDARPGPASDALVAHGVPVYTGHAAAHVDAADLVVVTAAVAHDNPEVRAARARGIPVLSHADVLGLLTARALGIAIAGTHGKTTTTALVGFLLERAGRDPTILAGAEMLNYGASVRLGRGPHVVVEADEYDRRFLRLTPRVAVVTSVEADHLDYFRDLAEIEATFAAFVDGLPAQAGWRARACRAAALADAPGEEALPRYGMEFVAVAPDGAEAAVRLPLVGRHNVANALAALAVAHGEGVPLAEAVAALPAFRGTRRRFQPLGRARGVAVVDDYAHHPTAVRATLAAARAVHAGPLWVAFQPHTRNRTSRLLAEFAAALALADGVLVTAIYEPVGREREPIAVSGADLAARVSGPPAVYVPDLESAAAYLAARLPPGALLLTMGAGDVDRLGPLVLEALGAAR